MDFGMKNHQNHFLGWLGLLTFYRLVLLVELEMYFWIENRLLTQCAGQDGIACKLAFVKRHLASCLSSFFWGIFCWWFWFGREFCKCYGVRKVAISVFGVSNKLNEWGAGWGAGCAAWSVFLQRILDRAATTNTCLWVLQSKETERLSRETIYNQRTTT